MSRKAKVFARIRSYQRQGSAVDGGMEFCVEYTLLDGALRSGQTVVTPPAIVNERELADDIKAVLAVALSEKYAVEYRDRDIVLAGL